MEATTDILALLDQIPQPVFLVKDKRITHLNHSAQTYQLKADTPVAELIAIGESEYQQFSDGRLLLTLNVDQVPYNASVIKVQGYDLFCLESEFQEPELRALALAAQNLRQPLSSAMIDMDNLLQKTAEQSCTSFEKEINGLTQHLYQLCRIVSNMSDAAIYNQQRSLRTETRDAVAVITEIVKKVSALTKDRGYHLELSTPNYPIFCLIDSEKLERGILNLISNALKYSPTRSTIRISLRQNLDKLYLSVQNSNQSTDQAIRTDIFSRFLREPALENDNSGIGLGLKIVRGAAVAHNGTLLINQPAGEGLKFTMSISLKNPGNSVLRSSVLLPVDYTGGYDRTLIELSEILPPDAFK